MIEFKSVNKLYEESFKKNWDRPALSNYQGVTLHYRDVARRIAKMHIMYEKCGLKKGDKVITAGGIYGTVDEVRDGYIFMEVDNNVKLKVDKSSIIRDMTDLQGK